MDREKVIKGLEFTKAMITFNPSTGEDIEPGNLNEENKTSYDACIGAIALLKEQEPKMVQSIRKVAYRTLGYCPSCGRGLDSYHDGNSGEHITHFCYNCGQAVKWE